jgi:hypothetical protein
MDKVQKYTWINANTPSSETYRSDFNQVQYKGHTTLSHTVKMNFKQMCCEDGTGM